MQVDYLIHHRRLGALVYSKSNRDFLFAPPKQSLGKLVPFFLVQNPIADLGISFRDL